VPDNVLIEEERALDGKLETEVDLPTEDVPDELLS